MNRVLARQRGRLQQQRISGHTTGAVLMVFQKIRWIGLVMLCLLGSPAHAVLDFEGKSRFIFNASAKRLAIVVLNDSELPTLLQTSVQWGEGNVAEVPLAVNKPLQILGPQGVGSIEVFYQGSGFPEDRESYLLLSVVDVSQAPPEPNSVQLALVHHFKLFFRPELEQTVEQAIAGMQWSNGDSAGITIKNTSPYFITLSDVVRQSSAGLDCGQVIDHIMVAPFSEQLVRNEECGDTSAVRYHYVTDGGNLKAYEATLSATQDSVGRLVQE